MNKKFKVKCPQCNSEFFYYDSEFRPFCTKKCQQIDLGHWFSESYVVPLKETGPDEAKEENDIEQDDEQNDSEYN